MFNIVAKNPLEAETVGQRRERKARESEGSIISSRSGVSTRAFESLRSGGHEIFGAWQRGGSKITITGPEKPDQILVTKTVEVSSYELPTFEHLHSPSFAPSNQRSPLWSDWETSVFTPTATHTLRKSSSVRAMDQTNSEDEEQRKSVYAATAPGTDVESLRESPAKVNGLLPRTELLGPLRSPIAVRRQDLTCAERPMLSRSASSASTHSAMTLGPFSPPASVAEENFGSETSRSTSPQEFKDYHVVGTPASTFSPDLNDDRTRLKSSNIPARVQPVGAAASEILKRRAKLQQKNLEQTMSARNTGTGYSKSLRLIELASTQILCQRLNEIWDVTDEDLREHLKFEQQLWAMNGLRRIKDDQYDTITLGGAEPSLNDSDVFGLGITESGEKLNICNNGAESWSQAASHPDTIVHHLSPPAFFDLSSAQCAGLPNMNTKLWANPPALPYEDASMNLIWSRSVALQLRSTDWPTFLSECVRVLKPGGSLELSVLDPTPRNAGPLLQKWIAMNLVLELERRFLVTRPAVIIPFWLEDVCGLTQPETKTLAFPAITDADSSEPGALSVETVDGQIQLEWITPRKDSGVEQLPTVVGRHFYQSLYREILSSSGSRRPAKAKTEDSPKINQDWWWKDPAIVKECKVYGTVFEMVTYTSRKQEVVE